MKYISEDGEIAEMISPFANKDGKVRVIIGDSNEQVVMMYDDFIAKYNSIPKDQRTAGIKP